MRRIFAVLVILLLTIGNAQAVDQQFVYTNAALGTASTRVNFGIQAKSMLVQNRNAVGGVSIYIDFLGDTATSADFELVAGSSIQLGSTGGRGGFGRVSVVSASATSSVQILAVN